MAKKSKAALKEEVDESFDNVKYLLNMISNDNGVPRNIRKVATESTGAIESLDYKENTPAVCASTCISLLEDLAQDLNCPLHTRTGIYQILAILEGVRDY